MQPRKSSSIIQVAKRARVSTATVSRVLSGYPRVAAKTRERTLRAVRELGYEPDAQRSLFFRSVRNHGTQMVGFLTSPSIHASMLSQDGFYSRFLGPVQQELQSRNYHLVLEDLAADSSLIGPPRCVAEGRVDGLLVEVRPQDVDFAIFRSFCRKIPTVFLNVETDLEGVDVVLPYVEQAAREQLRHLTQLGHRAIACFRMRSGNWQDCRFWRTYEETCAELGLTVPAAYLEPIQSGIGEDEMAVRQYLDRVLRCEVPPTGILTYDAYACELIRQLTSRGITVPHDISIVAFNDRPGVISPVPLTAYRQNFEGMAQMAVRLLLERIAEPQSAGRLLQVQGELIVRQSSGPRRPGRGDGEAIQY